MSVSFAVEAEPTKEGATPPSKNVMGFVLLFFGHQEKSMAPN